MRKGVRVAPKLTNLGLKFFFQLLLVLYFGTWTEAQGGHYAQDLRISPYLNKKDGSYFSCMFLKWYIFSLWRDEIACCVVVFGLKDNCFSLFHIYSNKSET